jgi:hypothetical protein
MMVRPADDWRVCVPGPVTLAAAWLCMLLCAAFRSYGLQRAAGVGVARTAVRFDQRSVGLTGIRNCQTHDRCYKNTLTSWR